MTLDSERRPVPRVALIGYGYWGRNIARNLDDLGALAAIAETDPTARAAAGRKHPNTSLCDAQGALENPALDAIAIATPAATHGALVGAALAAGKHVFVEKPLCLDLAEAACHAASAVARGSILMVGHLLHYHPAFVALAAAVGAGELGRLRYIYSHRLSLGKIRREENALWSFAPHDISMILALAGEMPERVTTNGGQYLTTGVADTTLSHLSFPNGVQAHVFVSWLHPYKDQRLVVIGERAMAVFNDVALGPEKLLLYRHKAHWDGDLPVVDKADALPIPYDESEPLRRECEAFLEAIRGRLRPPSDAAEGVRVLRILDACQRSLETRAPALLAGAAA